MKLFIISLLVWTIQAEILRNSDFETLDNWVCNGCTGSLASDGYSGSFSYKASARTASWQGPLQTLVIGSTGVNIGDSYHIEGYVKILGTNTSPQQVAITLAYLLTDGTKRYRWVASLNNVRPADGWQQLSGDFPIFGDSLDLVSLDIYVEGPAAEVEFLVDHLSLRQINQNEILENSEFETSAGWVCNGCTGSKDTDSYSGGYSYKAEGRTGTWSGPQQNIPVGPGGLVVGEAYFFSGWVKLLGDQQTSGQPFSITLRHTLVDGTQEWNNIAALSDVTPGKGWQYLVADFQLQSYSSPLASLVGYIQGPDASLNFLVDKLSLTPISTSENWRADADARIEQIRKSNLEIIISSAAGLSGSTVEITQLAHEFGFGTAVSANALRNNARYRQWFIDNFDWAVLENDLKWRQTEWNQGVLTFREADAAINILKRNSKKVRGHTVFWAATDANPNWVQSLSATNLKLKCEKRVQDVVGRYKGRLEHWDVNNEMLTNSFYKDVTGSDQIRYDMFKWVKKADPGVKRFLNDFNVVGSGRRTQAYVDQAKEFISAGVPVDALGAQGHMYTTKPSGPVILNRLDRLASTGLPIWITELDYFNRNATTRAEGLEDALRAFFSHPSVEGVLIWGFWDNRRSRAHASLVNGPNMTPNAAGLMWQRLIGSDWKSNKNIVIPTLSVGGTTTVSARVFHGDYAIKVKTGDTVVRLRQISVNSGGSGTTTLNINI